ncbi:MAG: universal stress protein, partial [Betaproteobacteria bacterium]
MYSRILVPTDGSDITGKAVQTAVSLARRLDAQLFAISVKEPFPYSAISEAQPIAPLEFYEALEKVARQRVSAVVEAAREQQVACSGYTVESLHP